MLVFLLPWLPATSHATCHPLPLCGAPLVCRPTTTKMLSNLKVFTIALLMRSVMKRRFTIIQWEALFLLVAGAWVQPAGDGGPQGALMSRVLDIFDVMM